MVRRASGAAKPRSEHCTVKQKIANFEAKIRFLATFQNKATGTKPVVTRQRECSRIKPGGGAAAKT